MDKMTVWLITEIHLILTHLATQQVIQQKCLMTEP